jgi:hypothetical protein
MLKLVPKAVDGLGNPIQSYGYNALRLIRIIAFRTVCLASQHKPEVVVILGRRMLAVPIRHQRVRTTGCDLGSAHCGKGTPSAPKADSDTSRNIKQAPGGGN